MKVHTVMCIRIGFGRREVDDEQVEWCADESCSVAIGV